MPASVILPDLGTGPVHLSVWYADPGDLVYEGDRLVEVLIPGATFDVPAPATGRLVEKRAFPDDPLEPGQVIGMIEAEDNVV
jgi:pyruvate/2-oxoglutarate dehydrogenase complex dihydrolipoamide acyltransferase (E2) component